VPAFIAPITRNVGSVVVSSALIAGEYRPGRGTPEGRAARHHSMSTSSMSIHIVSSGTLEPP
jgi:hypothetical protein